MVASAVGGAVSATGGSGIGGVSRGVSGDGRVGGRPGGIRRVSRKDPVTAAGADSVVLVRKTDTYRGFLTGTN
ncbi:hypothetical protein OsJ_28671 [Oryza sativa Japonica Group]|uniref:Uncharacterized protein n=2 Tax=Oryza TaxID=4527 RepID=A3BWW1_ORYSJ|nr:hypothetical protein OsJ_28671 [Oryza sativa Japonica Group]BAD29617.1 hypothetical protein [Oryza sativa Japonica Group]BAD29651.1 hypothetical protein [Oryza sativa Japonica Group]